jgi:hypothetical protein
MLRIVGPDFLSNKLIREISVHPWQEVFLISVTVKTSGK